MSRRLRRTPSFTVVTRELPFRFGAEVPGLPERPGCELAIQPRSDLRPIAAPMDVDRPSDDRAVRHHADVAELGRYPAVGGPVAIVAEDEEMVRRNGRFRHFVDFARTNVEDAMRRHLARQAFSEHRSRLHAVVAEEACLPQG